jgi:3-hydroxy acid dehydrogenase/malonic semialdehyde reductase
MLNNLPSLILRSFSTRTQQAFQTQYRKMSIFNTSKLVGKTALITGASSGIGASTAILFAKAGSNVVILARRANNLNEVKAKCEAAYKEFGHKEGKVVTIEADMQKREDLNSITEKLEGLTVDM